VQPPQRAVRRRQVERQRVERAAEPRQQVPVCLAAPAPERRQEIRVPPDPAAILGRAGPAPRQAGRAPRAGVRPQQALDDDAVVPAVAEVVLVLEGRPDAGGDLRGLRQISDKTAGERASVLVRCWRWWLVA
jgi:hypothetical protein